MKLRTKISLLAILPVVILGIVSEIIAAKQMEKAIINQSYSGMEAAAISIENIFNFASSGSYRIVDGELWKGDDLNISQSMEIVDEIRKQTGLDVTVFFGDTRYLTTIVDANGQRQIGTSATEAVVNQVLKGGNTYGNDNVNILGTRYICYYIPVEESGTPVGMIFLGRKYAEVSAEIQKASMDISIPILILLAIACVVAIIMSRGIIKALNMGISLLTNLEQGKLGIKMPEILLKRKDIVGDMCRSVRALDEKLTEIITNIQKQCNVLTQNSEKSYEATNKVMRSVEQISASVQEVAAATSMQATEAEDANRNIVEMGNLIENTASQAELMSQAAGEMNTASFTVKDTLRELSSSMEAVEQAVDGIYNQTNQTHESVQRINEVTEMISEIAAQTNLLSLNASIEAARAGENGKGFAVVAAEIQKLAEQSDSSAMQIHDMLAELQSNSEHSVSSMDEVKDIVRLQSDKLQKTNEMFATLETGIDQSSSGIAEIDKDAVDLDEARKETIEMVQKVSGASQEIAANMEETAASVEIVTSMVVDLKEQAEELEEIAEELKQMVSVFEV